MSDPSWSPEKASPAPAKRAPEPIPITLIAGFLGAGKTTLLNRLLRHPGLSDALILINEFGEVGIDHLLVERLSGDTVMLASGCVCCALRGDLIATLEDLLRRLDNGRIEPFRHVAFETSGLSDPAPILHSLMRHPYLALRFRVARVITVVDAVAGVERLDERREALRQAAIADCIVVSKSDLLDERARGADLARLEAWLDAVNPGVPIVDAVGAADLWALLEPHRFDPDASATQMRPWLRLEPFHEVLRDLTPAPTRSDRSGSIRSVALRASASLAPASLEAFLGLLASEYGAGILRVKGLVKLADDPDRPLAIHGLRHAFYPPRRLPCWPDGDRDTRIVVIVEGADREAIRRQWKAFVGLGSAHEIVSLVAPGQPPRRGLFS